MTYRISWAVIGMCVVCVLSTAGAPAAQASDFEIDTSNVASLKAGDKMAKGTNVVLPDGGKITLIDRSSGSPKQRVCVGKFEGLIEACPATPAGGSPRVSPGATRGVTR